MPCSVQCRPCSKDLPSSILKGNLYGCNSSKFYLCICNSQFIIDQLKARRKYDREMRKVRSLSVSIIIVNIIMIQGAVFLSDIVQRVDEPVIKVKKFWTRDKHVAVEGHHRVPFLVLYKVSRESPEAIGRQKGHTLTV